MGKSRTAELDVWYEGKKIEKTIDSLLADGAPHLSHQQIKYSADLLYDMVEYEPERRLSAEDVFQRLMEHLRIERAKHSTCPFGPPPVGVANKTPTVDFGCHS